jgi:hypothetical protein
VTAPLPCRRVGEADGPQAARIEHSACSPAKVAFVHGCGLIGLRPAHLDGLEDFLGTSCPEAETVLSFVMATRSGFRCPGTGLAG